MKYIKNFLPAILCLSFLSACKKPLEYPLIPAIDFKTIGTTRDANGKDQNVIVTFGFTDGDGDIGYYSVESGQNDPVFDNPQSIYYNNFQVKTYHMINGTWTTDTVDISARLPYLTPDGSNKALKGEIKRELPVAPGLVNDTFYYEIFIYDRALHKSNTVSTTPVIITTQ